ncbi:MAG: zinc ribbon domain-containing protein [Phycisphaerales bacterium]|nr:zinc ribbon domain-containing protein [Phycisphaerales bacterium]MCB9835892.1 zinc ribbon domain-containing protein [Phycisphaera sp.]
MSWEDDHGPDFDELDPEGPSPADIRRLDRAGSPCPSCGSEIYDDASICPVCGEYILAPKQGLAKTYLWPIVGAIVLIIFVLTWVL